MVRLANCPRVRAWVWTQAGWLHGLGHESHRGAGFPTPGAQQLHSNTVILSPCSLFKCVSGPRVLYRKASRLLGYTRAAASSGAPMFWGLGEGQSSQVLLASPPGWAS